MSLNKNIPINILLVDDDIRNLDVLESVLSSPDYRLVRAETAQEALTALMDGVFAAIVLDIQMPGTSGIELANLIKQRKRTQYIPIIFLTAYLQEEADILQCYEIGAVDFLTKPINPKILKSKIMVFGELFRKNQELARLNNTLENEISHRHQTERELLLVNNELEARVNERTVELTRANRAKDNFLAALSHELRTPLNPVLLLASELANDPDLPELIRDKFNIIAKNVGVEARLIDDLLDMNRIVHGKLVVDKQLVSVHTVLQEAMATVQEDVRTKQITPHLDFRAEKCVLFGDAVRLQQIFWNVLKNAVKFTPRGGQVTVQTFSDVENGKVVIKVIDTGIGMTPKEVGYIFSAFSQGDHASAHGSHRFGGLGLGLAISRMLVELHSGTIKAESAGPNQGAVFTMAFPFVEAVEKNNHTSSVESAAAIKPQKVGLRVLLVEDHESTRTALVYLLNRRHYKVAAAGSLAEARQMCRQGEFDLVLSDIGLPDGDGYALMSELRDSHGLKGIALTGHGMEQDIEQAKSAGFIAHLIKPVNIESLEKALKVFN
jgi:signal transduction histidine kinase